MSWTSGRLKIIGEVFGKILRVSFSLISFVIRVKCFEYDKNGCLVGNNEDNDLYDGKIGEDN